MRWPVLLALCACDRVFGLSTGEPVDASNIDAINTGPCVHPSAVYIAPGDFDGDGIDNCHDLCPFTPDGPDPDNHDGDGDGIPDRCDPNASGGGALADCLLLFDVFDDSAHPPDGRWQFKSFDGMLWHWGVCQDGHVGFCSPPGDPYAVLFFSQALDSVTLVAADAGLFAPTSSTSVFQVFADSTVHDNTLDGRACGFGVDNATQTTAHLSDISLMNGTVEAEINVVDSTPGSAYTIGNDVEVQYLPQNNSSCTQLLTTAAQLMAGEAAPLPPEKDHIVGVRAGSLDAVVHDVRVFGADCVAP